MQYDIIEQQSYYRYVYLEKGEYIMTKADEMRKMATQNKKTKLRKSMIMKTLNKTYAKFICTVEDSANKGISKRICGEIPRMPSSEKYTFEWKNKDFHGLIMLRK